MLEVRLLGKFDVRRDGEPVVIPSRPAQSLFAYLVINPGITHRREMLAGLLAPDASEENARSTLRHALWRVRKAVETSGQVFFYADDLSVTFRSDKNFWLDTTILESKKTGEQGIDDLVQQVTVYSGDLLPGFYDDWVVLERERLQSIFQVKMKQLLDRLVAARRWEDILYWGERWIALGHLPEPAYSAIMIAQVGLGDLSGALSTYRRCEDALRAELGVEPSEPTRMLYEQLLRGEPIAGLTTAPSLYYSAVQPASGEPEAPFPGEPPYKGLQYFDESDASLFYGRELLTGRLVNRLEAYPFLAVIGASGSGKSSILRAGLIPAMKSRQQLASDHPIYVITPTTHPLQSLAISLTRASESVTAATTFMDDLSKDSRSLEIYIQRLNQVVPTSSQKSLWNCLLVVDQFEELFTLCKEESERSAFIDNLMVAASSDGAATVVIALRADFYAYCAQYPGLRQEIANHQEYIGAMGAEELRQAIEEPAKHCGWMFEPGLADLLVREVVAEPGALPLLSHALLETWKRRRGRVLTLAGYAEAGGVSGAIARTVESIYQRFTPEQQHAAQRIFLRLTELGEGTPDTQRRAALSELVSGPEGAPLVHTVLQILADARLITIQAETAEVAHEALIREWPMLRKWLAEDRESLRLHRSLTEAAQEWEELERDPGELYRGARLTQAVEWAAEHTADLNQLESEFLEESRRQAEQEAAEREGQHQRELEAAQKLAEAEKQRAEEQSQAAEQLRKRAIFLFGAFILALMMAGIALYLGSLARQSARDAQAAIRLATAREYAAAAVNNLGIDPERSILLALQAITETYSVDHTWTAEAETALHSAIQASRIRLTVGDPTVPMSAVAYDPGGGRFVTTSVDGSARVWNAADGSLLKTLPIQAGKALAFSPDGKQLAIATKDGTVTLWDFETEKVARILGEQGALILTVAYSPDGTRLAAGGMDPMVKVWELQKDSEPLILAGHNNAVTDVTFTRDGSRLATASLDGTAKVWDAVTGHVDHTFSSSFTYLGNISWAFWGVAFSPDGKQLLAVGEDRKVNVWDLTTGQNVASQIGHSATIRSCTFSKDGKYLATASENGMILIWDAKKNNYPLLYSIPGHKGGIVGLDFNPDGTRLVTASVDGTARIWNIGVNGEILALPTFDNFGKIIYSPDGKRLAAGYYDKAKNSHGIKVWDSSSGEEQLYLSGFSARVSALAFSPDGSRLAAATDDGQIDIRDVKTGNSILSYQGHKYAIMSIAFSRDGKLLATGGMDYMAAVWDSASGRQLFGSFGRRFPIGSVAFSPDGKTLAVGALDGVTRLYDISNLPQNPGTSDQPDKIFAGHGDMVWGIAFSQDGKLLATGSIDKTAKLWDVSTGKELYTLRGHTGWITALDFSPDESELATGSADGTAKIWNIKTGQEQLTIPAGDAISGVDGVKFSPDGKRLAASSYSDVRVFFLQVQDLIDLAHQRVTRSLTTDECQRYLHLNVCPVTVTSIKPIQLAVPTQSTSNASLPAGVNHRICYLEPRFYSNAAFDLIAYQGVQAVARQPGWISKVAESQDAGDDQKNLISSLQWGCDFTTMTTWENDVLRLQAQANPGQKYQIFDTDELGDLHNVWNEIYATDQAAFLAGYASASVSKTGKVGVFGAFPIPQVTDFLDGFTLGVEYFNEKHAADVAVLGWNVKTREGIFANTFDSSKIGAEIARQLLDSGADIILPVAGPYVGTGALTAVHESGGGYVIGADKDWALNYPNYADIILTSIQKNIDASVLRAAKAVEEGTFTGGVHIGNLENGVVSMAPFYKLETIVPVDVQVELKQLQADIIAGKIKTKP